jgi:hypothetical protein
LQKVKKTEMSLENWVRENWSALIACRDKDGLSVFQWPAKHDVHKSYMDFIGNEEYFNGLLKRKDGKKKLTQAVRDERDAIFKVINAIINSGTGEKI